MTDDLKRYMPQAKLAPKTRGPGNRYIGVMNEHPEGKWVRLEDVATLRLDVANLRSQLADGSFYQEKDIDALQDRTADLESIIRDLIGETGVPWAKAVKRGEAALRAVDEGEK